jgi:hypothetical protein
VTREQLGKARHEKFDEFYTQYADIEREMNAYLEFDPNVFRDKRVLLPCDDPEWSNFTKYFAQNFERLGLNKLTSTSYAPHARLMYSQPTLFETNNSSYKEEKSAVFGRIFELTKDTNGDKRVNIDDLEWTYLKGDGDFQSDEVKKLRDEADIIVTNPPFSLFRRFLNWIVDGEKKFVIIGNKNTITYKEAFPLIMKDKMWVGSTPMGKDMLFRVPDESARNLVSKGKEGSKWRRVDGEVFARSSSVWFTNIEHGRRHQPLMLMTMAENKKFSKHPGVKGIGYKRYVNYKAIEVPFTDAIPSDYKGVMGVPISFLDKYNPDQFEIVRFRHGDDGKDLRLADGSTPYFRILIRHRSPAR